MVEISIIGWVPAVPKRKRLELKLKKRLRRKLEKENRES